ASTENERPCGIHLRHRNMDEDPQATDWPPPEAFCREIVHRVFAATLSGQRASPASFRNLCPPVPPGTAPRPAGSHQPPSPARTSSRSTSVREPQDCHSEIGLVTKEAMPIVGFRNR